MCYVFVYGMYESCFGLVVDIGVWIGCDVVGVECVKWCGYGIVVGVGLFIFGGVVGGVVVGVGEYFVVGD